MMLGLSLCLSLSLSLCLFYLHFSIDSKEKQEKKKGPIFWYCIRSISCAMHRNSFSKTMASRRRNRLNPNQSNTLKWSNKMSILVLKEKEREKRKKKKTKTKNGNNLIPRIMSLKKMKKKKRKRNNIILSFDPFVNRYLHIISVAQ